MDYTKIKSERQFRDATGYSKENFQKLLLAYEDTYFKYVGQTYEEYVEENVTEPPKLSTLGEGLFFVLFQLKNDLIFGSLGLVFDMSVSSAHVNFKCFLNLLEQTLEKKSHSEALV